jgi:hypothetical protein
MVYKQLVDSRMFRKKARLILIYKFVSNKIIINIFINYSLHNFTNTTYQPPFESKTNDSITDIFVTASEIVDFIQILDLKKASGPDKISHKMLKIAPEKIVEPLQIIFNKSLRQGKYPSSWKIAHVIAILKKCDASLPSNYRPISLISCVGKIMERVCRKDLLKII